MVAWNEERESPLVENPYKPPRIQSGFWETIVWTNSLADLFWSILLLFVSAWCMMECLIFGASVSACFSASFLFFSGVGTLALAADFVLDIQSHKRWRSEYELRQRKKQCLRKSDEDSA